MYICTAIINEITAKIKQGVIIPYYYENNQQR